MKVLFIFGLIVCISFCGLCIDIGRMELLKVQLQNAADAAAVGAELESERVLPGGNGTQGLPYQFDWIAQGKQDASINGFTDQQNGTTITIAQNPATGPYAGRYDAIQVTVSRTFKTIFLGLLNKNTYTVTTQAVALVPPCSYFLGGYNAQYGNSFDNASATFFATCPIYSNYNFVVDGFSRGWGFGTSVSGAAGNSGGGGWFSQQTESGYGGAPPSQNPTFGVPVMTDPLLNTVTQPVLGTCNYISKVVTGVAVLNPGTYCGTSSTVGLKITSATVTLNPGLYIITGGASWNASTVTGTGVTLFFTKGNGASYGQFLVGSTGTCTVALSAPVDASAGGIPAILFFADRNWTTTSSADFSFDTYSSFTGDGIWYLPNTGMYLWLNAWSVPNYGSFVARNLYYFAATITQNANYSWLSGGNPFRTQPVLVQ